MNVFSTLLKTIIPKQNKIIVIDQLIINAKKVIELVPRKASLNNSTGAVIGFSKIIYLNFSGTTDKGYTTGVKNIHNCTIKFIARVKSLYLAVIEENNNPNPILNIANWSKIKGKNKINMLGNIGEPMNLK